MKKNTFIIMLIIVFMIVMTFIKEDHLISFAERRQMHQIPELSLENIRSGVYFKELEDYLSDQIAFREGFRSLKFYFDQKVLGKADTNGLFEYQAHISKLEYPTDKASFEHFFDYISRLKLEMFKEQSVFLTVIPDKNYYMDGVLNIDYEQWMRDLDGLDGIENINILDDLSLQAYLKSDPHWRQDQLIQVIDHLMATMEVTWSENDFDTNYISGFYGAYNGQSGLIFKGEALPYMTHPDFESILVYDYEKEHALADVYDASAIDGVDPYDFYLGGASPLMTIENPEVTTNKELIVFRDSFGASMLPLMIPSYSKITLVDTRYMPAEILSDYIVIDEQDVLFLYSGLVINNSQMLK